MKLSLVALGGHKADASATILVFENDSYGGVASVHWEMQVIPYQPTVGCDAPYDIATACSFNQPSGSCSAGGYAWHQDGWGDPQAAGCDNGNLHGKLCCSESGRPRQRLPNSNFRLH